VVQAEGAGMAGKARTILTLAAAATFLGGGAASLAAEPTTKELMEQIQQLQTKVQELENKQQQQQQIVSKADQDRAIDEVIKDAQKRSQWLQSDSVLAGFENDRFFLKSADGNFLLRPWLQLQPRYVTTYSQGGAGAKDNTNSGFEIRRMKIGFDGNMFTPKLTYQINWATNRDGGNLQLENAYAMYQLADDWAVQGGQFKDPLARESLVNSKYLLAAERSLTDDVFTGGENYVQGVAVIYSKETWHATAAFTDGALNNFNQNFQDFPTNNADFGGAARVEYKVFGDWQDYNEFAPYNIKKDLLVIGAAADYTEAGDTGYLVHTVDAQYNLTSGWTFYAAYLARYVSNGPVSSGAPAPGGFDGYDWSAEAMVAYRLDRHWEPFARYAYLHLTQGEVASSENDVNEMTAGVNYYWYGQAAKFTLDFVYYPNGSPVSDTGSGVLANDGSNEFVVRVQFQLLI
jgi:TolA-binding protein